MAARTSEKQVRNIIDTSLTSPQVTAFIDDANLWVTEELVGEGLTANRLETIERYLACAFIRIRDLGLVDVGMDKVKETYQVDPKVTEYLTHAAAFDDTGKLRRAFIAAPDRQGAVIARFGTGFKDET